MTRHPAVRNHLLSALPPEVLDQLLPKLHRVPLILRKTLIRPAEPIEAVYFVESGWVSLVAHMDEGTQAEVGLVGREGLVGQALINGVETAFAEAFVRSAWRGSRDGGQCLSARAGQASENGQTI